MVHMIRKKLCYDTREGIIHIFENECKAVCVQNKILGCVCTQFVYFIKKKLGTKRNTTLITHCATGPVSCGCIFQYFGAKHDDCKNDGFT